MPITTRPPVVMVEGTGSWLRDSEGREYLDFVQGWAVNCLGHCHPAVVEALRTQAGAPRSTAAPPTTTSGWRTWPRWWPRATGLDARLLLQQRRGGERGRHQARPQVGPASPRRRLRDRHHAGQLHGRTLATMSASGKAAFEPLFEPKVPGFRKVPLNDLDALAAAITERTVAVMLGADPGRGRCDPGHRRVSQRRARADP